MTFYEEICKLKDIERRGWAYHGVPKQRKENDAEHTFSLLMLAIELMAHNNLNLDEEKVLKMCVIHELCEIDVGDTIPADNVPLDKKYKKEHECIKRIATTYSMPEVESIWLEYLKKETGESRFVKMLDKVDAILQADIYAKQFNIADKLTDYIGLAQNEWKEFNKIKTNYTINFYNEICKLKELLRRGWFIAGVPKEDGESDADHTYSMMLLAIELISKNNLGFNQLKVLKMVAFHDLCEIDAGDTTPMDGVDKNIKYNNEYNCIKRLAKTYNLPEVETLWLEYENQTSKEGEFVELLDRVDAILQAEIYSKRYKKPEIENDFKNNAKAIYNKFLKLKR